MAGPQHPFKLDSYEDVNNVEKLLAEISFRLSKIIEEYYITNILKLQLIVKVLDVDTSLKLRVDNKILHEIDETQVFKVHYSRAIPLLFG
jgi:hypothetical protein